MEIIGENLRMKIKSLNNCGVEIVDVDISNLSDEQYTEIKNIYQDQLIIVFKNQKVEALPFAKLSYRMGTGIVNWSGCLWNKHGNLHEGVDLNTGIWHDVVPDPFTFAGADDEFYVQRVTGMKINGKNSGVFPQPELDWHSNYNKVNTPGRGVALQAVSGVNDSATAFMDTTKAYAALSDELKERCQGVIGQYKYNIQEWGAGLPDWQMQAYTTATDNSNYYEMPLVNINKFNGKPGLYFHFLNKCSFPSDLELLNILKDHCLNEKFIYNHWWEPGDIVISEQLLTLHKRILTNPSLNENRVLHRYTFSMS